MATNYGVAVEDYLAGLKAELKNALDEVHKAEVQAEIDAVTAAHDVAGVVESVEAGVAGVVESVEAGVAGVVESVEAGVAGVETDVDPDAGKK